MYTFTVIYDIKYELSIAPNYVWNKHKQCYNIKTGRFIKQIMCGGSIGYCINGKFKSLKALRPLLRKPKIEDLPF